MSRPISRSWRLLLIGLSITVVCVDLRALLSVDRVPAFRDLLPFIVPIKHFLGEHFRRGEIPYWNPWIFLGSPFIAAMHMGAFYPPSAFLLLPLPVGFNLYLLSHYVVALIGMSKFLETRGLGPVASALGGLTFVVAGFTISLLNTTKELHGVAWLPWALFFWQRWLGRGTRRDLALTMIAVALQILGGSVETMLMTLALLGGIGLEASASRARDLARAGVGLAFVVVAACALTAFQLVPTLEYALQSGRAGALSWSEVFHWSLEPVSLLQLVLPISARAGAGLPALGIGLEPVPPQNESLYFGIPALCLAVAGLGAGGKSRLWGVILAASVVAALGSHTPVLPFLYRHVPAIFGKLRYPEKFLLLSHVSVCVLAAYGLASLERRRSWSSGIAIAAAVVILVAALGFQWFANHDAERYLACLSALARRSPTAIVAVAESLRSRTPWLVMLASCLVALLTILVRVPASKQAVCVALFLLQAVDLSSVRWRSLATTSWPAIEATRPFVDVGALRESGERVFHYDDVRSEAGSARPFHLADWTYSDADADAQYRRAWATLVGNVGMYYRVGTVTGGDGFFRSDLKAFLERLPMLSLDGAVRALRAVGVGYFLGPTARESPLLELVARGGEDSPYVYRVRDAAPFVFLARRLYVARNESEAVDRLASEEFDSRSEAVVDELPERWTESATPASGETVDLVANRGDVLEIRVSASAERLVVVNQSDYPGWVATVDGVRVPIVRSNALVQGIRVPAGGHRVVLRYRPRGLYWGFAVGAAAAGAFAIVFASERKRSSVAL